MTKLFVSNDKISKSYRDEHSLRCVISFCLYGTDPKYTVGAVENARLAREIYPGWETWFYVGSSVPKKIVQLLRGLGDKVIPMQGPEDASATLWRFLPFCENGIDIVLSRDCDSRLSYREKQAVDEWLASGKTYHIMRDHPSHSEWIMAGMWGARCDVAGPLLQPVLEKYLNGRHAIAQYGCDQSLLARYVYPFAKKDAFVHDSFFLLTPGSRKFSSPREFGRFIGEIIDEKGVPNVSDAAWLSRVERSPWLRCKRILRSLLIRWMYKQ